MSGIKIEEILSCQQLPSLPAIAVKVLELSEKPDVQIPELAEVIQNDQALTAKILRTVNSSFYGLSNKCETVSRAMTYLGLNTIKSLVLGFSLARMSREQADAVSLTRHWQRAIYSAAAARKLAQELGHCDPDEAFIAALMQDIGSLAMHAAMNRDYVRIIEQAGNDHFQLPAVEREVFGFDHAQVGAALGERWRMPEPLVDIIRNHHDIERGAHLNLLRMITLGTQVALIAAVSTNDGLDCSETLERFTSCAADWYDMNPETAVALVEHIAADAMALAELLEIGVGDQPDIADILARAEECSLMHQMRVQQEAEQLKKQNVTLSRMAQTCGLTGLANRRRFDEELRMCVDHAITQNESLAIIFIDADHFKPLNDTLGHQAGDIALIEMAGRINGSIPDRALACRYGGEEFVVLLPGHGRAEAALIAETIRTTINQSPIDIHGAGCSQPSVNVTVSLGVAAIEEQTRDVLTNPNLLVKAADRALYHAKLSGRDQVQIFVPHRRKTKAA